MPHKIILSNYCSFEYLAFNGHLTFTVGRHIIYYFFFRKQILSTHFIERKQIIGRKDAQYKQSNPAVFNEKFRRNLKKKYRFFMSKRDFLSRRVKNKILSRRKKKQTSIPLKDNGRFLKVVPLSRETISYSYVIMFPRWEGMHERYIQRQH